MAQVVANEPWIAGFLPSPSSSNVKLPLSIAKSPPLETRTYPSLSALEFDAFHARIWAGLHYRKCMTDTYEMGHGVATRVMGALGV